MAMSHAPTLSRPAKGWTRRKQARPGEILEAALSVFAKKGFAAARMEDIAARAGVTKGTIYLYFSSKDEVFKTLVRESVSATIADVARQARAFEGSSRQLLTMLLTMINVFLHTGDRAVLPKIIVAESGNFPELARFWRSEVIDKVLGIIGGVIARGIERGEFRELAPGHVARLCVAPLLLGAIWRTTFAQMDPIPYDTQKLFETHIDVLLKGLEPEGSTP